MHILEFSNKKNEHTFFRKKKLWHNHTHTHAHTHLLTDRNTIFRQNMGSSSRHNIFYNFSLEKLTKYYMTRRKKTSYYILCTHTHTILRKKLKHETLFLKTFFYTEYSYITRIK